MMSYDYPHPVSRTYQYKKITKPLLERKRRARINRCLDELKDLMVDALETEGENISKLEKADILELTVRHLQRLHASRPSGLSSSSFPNEDVNTAENRWQSGFGHCAAEACRYLASLPGESGERLARHLASGLQTTGKKNLAKRKIDASSTMTIDESRNDNISESIASNFSPDVTMTFDSRDDNESPNDSSRYSVLSESSDHNDFSNSPTISSRIYETLNDDPRATKSKVVLPNLETKNSPPIPTTNDKKSSKCDPRQNGGGDDDEEIDVEGVDEGDPMWRPW